MQRDACTSWRGALKQAHLAHEASTGVRIIRCTGQNLIWSLENH
jgi:hypothetical protein